MEYTLKQIAALAEGQLHPKSEETRLFTAVNSDSRLIKGADTLFAALKGDTRSTEKLLELINPKRYGKKATISLPTDGKDAPKEMRISFVSATNSEEEEPEIVSAEG